MLTFDSEVIALIDAAAQDRRIAGLHRLVPSLVVTMTPGQSPDGRVRKNRPKVEEHARNRRHMQAREVARGWTLSKPARSEARPAPSLGRPGQSAGTPRGSFPRLRDQGAFT